MDAKDKEIWDLKRTNRLLADEVVALKKELAKLTKNEEIEKNNFLYYKRVKETEDILKGIFKNAEFITRRIIKLPHYGNSSGLVRVPMHYEGRLTTIILWNDDKEVEWNEKVDEDNNKFYEKLKRQDAKTRSE